MREMYKPKAGAIVRVELVSKDPAASRKFLETVFGWKFTKVEAEGMEYHLFDAANDPGGHLMPRMENMPSRTVNYVLVNSVVTASKKIVKSGGKILMAKTEIPNVGWFAVYEVPGGFV